MAPLKNTGLAGGIAGRWEDVRRQEAAQMQPQVLSLGLAGRPAPVLSFLSLEIPFKFPFKSPP